MDCKCDKERTKPLVTKNEEVYLRKGKSLPCIGHKLKDLILNKYRFQGMTPSEGSYVGQSSCNEYTDRLGASHSAPVQ